jgi:predicted transcriptional regulator
MGRATMGRNKPQVVLTRMELEIMRILWDGGPEPLTVREVLVHLNAARARPTAYTTVQTVLIILKDKQAVQVEPGPGRAHRFRPRLSRDEVTATMVGDLVERLFDGCVQPLLHRLVEAESLSAEELETLKRWIETRLKDARQPP